MRLKKTSRAFLYVMLLIFTSCISHVKVEAQTQYKEIDAIENSLLKPIRIKDEPQKTYNLFERMKYHNVPGLSIAIVKDGKLHWTKSYGKLNTDNDALVNEKTMFQAASVSKPFTALGILKLVEKKKINLDDDVNDYLKGWQIEDNEFTKTEKVTIRRLLSHTAGISGHGFNGYSQSENLPTTLEVLNGEGNSRMITIENTPGKEWRYSGGGYIILQKLIEDITRMPFEIYMDNEILKPLKMTNSTFQQPLDRNLHKNISSAHNNNGEVVAGDWHNYPETAAGGLWSTPKDIAKYCIEIQNILAGKENGLLTKASIDMMLTKDLHNWGLGLLIEGSGDSLRLSHEGKNEGYFAYFLAFASQGNAVIIMTNGNTGTLINELLKSVSNYYQWNSHNQRIIEPKAISNKDLEKYIGRYLWIDRPNSNWTVEVVLQEGKLNFVAPNFPIERLTPLDDYSFIDVETSSEIVFKMTDINKINGLTWHRYRFEKID